jgi:hypothetical protein
MSMKQPTKGTLESLWRSVLVAVRRFAAPSSPSFAFPAGMVLPTTSLPPAFTRRERAVVDRFFGRR